VTTGFVLTVLEQVLGRYISDLMLRGTAKKRRAEVIVAVRDELRRSGGVIDEVSALQLAVRELDLLVEGGKALEWRDDELAIQQKRSLPRRRLNPEAAIRELQSSVERRRSELGLPAPQGSDELIDPALGPPVDPAAIESRRPADEEHGGSWRSRVMGLQEDVIRERRARTTDQ
jgi:hypothetical protein